jgi:hypothetical protein
MAIVSEMEKMVDQKQQRDMLVREEGAPSQVPAHTSKNDIYGENLNPDLDPEKLKKAIEKQVPYIYIYIYIY